MEAPQLLILCRHAESEGNKMLTDAISAFDASAEVMRSYRAAISNHPRKDDWAITENLGVAQARKLGLLLKQRFGSQWFDVLYVSELRRARETCLIALPNAQPIIDKRLNEFPRGLYTYEYECPEQEVVPRNIISEYLANRDSWINDLFKNHSGKIVWAFVHADWLSSLLEYPNPNINTSSYKGKREAANASITVFKRVAAQPNVSEYPYEKLVLQEYGTLSKK